MNELPILTEADVGTRTVRAFVHREVGVPGRVEKIRLRRVGPHDVRVKIEAVGICHSDLSLANGTLAQKFPAVLGHEASGVVSEVGSDIHDLAVGDKVILLWNPACGECWFCEHESASLCTHAADYQLKPHALDAGGEVVWAGVGVGAFAEETVIPASSARRFDGIEFNQAAMIGCASVTGVGAAINTGKVAEGQYVAVVVLGGVGLSAVQGALLSGAAKVFSIDRSADRLAIAERLGGIPIEAGDDIARRIRKLADGRGVDVAIDCVGAAATIRQSWEMTRRGGTAVVVGVGGKDQSVSFTPLELFYFARNLVGCVGGAGTPDVDYPRLVEWARTGKLVTDGLITSTFGLDGIEDAFRLMREASGGRAIIYPTRTAE